ncbi:MAG: PhoH family protein [Aquificota bacterium]|jgi:phosphate starvation-inducible PhoH-like protein|nr:PhoH family protein [Aquificaceae bacterium]MDM7267348.1 PhoH family protein [Aquificaceae bacterium]QWK12837.1 MAG: PhoH family protein [Aquificota bacterium]HAV39647.1 phosphate starvation-inducible protein PhoH [Aquificaceae bacterium]
MMTERVEEKLDLGSFDEKFYAIVGRGDENLKYFSQIFDVKISARGTEIIIRGEEDKVRLVYEFLKEIIKDLKNSTMTSQEVRERAKNYLQSKTATETVQKEEVILITHRKKAIVPKTHTQRLYIDAIKNNDIVFGIGPAGTGKTYLAMAMALAHLKANKVNKIILTRPAVEAGEKLGFLPGGIAEKVDPYLRPLYDALYDMVDYDKAGYMLERNIIEIAPLAFMRGRTLNDAFIILDEAQNSTKEQMKMFLTRIGFGSKVVITGDITQIDLPKREQSGLVEAIKVLKGIEGISFVWFKEEDVVRHPIVARIIKAYEEFERSKEEQSTGKEGERESSRQVD